MDNTAPCHHYPKPAVSVIIPCYKVENFLNQCIDSIVNQTFRDIEIILINDGSPDNCLQICQHYACLDSRIVVIDQENLGVSEARNNGIRIARGDYILFVDSDDWLEIHAIEKLVLKARQFDLDVVLFNITNTNEAGVPYREFIDMTRLQKAVTASFSDHFFCPSASFDVFVLLPDVGCAYLYSKKLLVDHSVFFIPGLRFEDNAFLRKVFLLSRRMGVLNENLYFYRRRVGSLTSNYTHFLNDLFKIKVVEVNTVLEYKPDYYKRFLRITVDILCDIFINLSLADKNRVSNGFYHFLIAHQWRKQQIALGKIHESLIKQILRQREFSKWQFPGYYWHYLRCSVLSTLSSGGRRERYRNKASLFRRLINQPNPK